MSPSLWKSGLFCSPFEMSQNDFKKLRRIIQKPCFRCLTRCKALWAQLACTSQMFVPIFKTVKLRLRERRSP